MSKFDQVTDSLAFHGEGPVWWQATKQMRFLDMLDGSVLALDSSGTVSRLSVGSKVAACLRPRAAGGAIIARERDIAVCAQEDLSDLRTLTGDIIDATKRFNEGACDPDGRFYAGNLSWQKVVGGSAMYRVDTDANYEQVLDGLTTSNGLDFSPDHSLAYYNDTETMRTDVFDYSSETGLTNRRPFVRYDKPDGRPDGLCVDAEGGIWVAMNRAGHVRRYSPNGHLDAKIDLPVTLTTAVSFGGEDLDTLFVTTSREGLAAGDEPKAGSLFAWKPGVQGLVPLAYKG